MLIDAHVHIFPNVMVWPKSHTHGAGYGRIDAGDGIAQDVLPAINENTSHTLQMLLHEMRQAQVDHPAQGGSHPRKPQLDVCRPAGAFAGGAHRL